MKKQLFQLSLSTLTLILPFSLVGQDISPFYLMHEDVVKPSMTALFEQEFKALNEARSAHDYPVGHTTLFTTDYRYTHITPMEDLVDIERMNDAWKDMMEMAESGKSGEATRLNNLCTDAEVYHHKYVLKGRPELNYTPDDPNYSEEGFTYRKLFIFSIKRGQEAEAEEVLRAYKQRYADTNKPYAYRVFQGYLGVDLGTYYLVYSAPTTVDHHMRELQAAEEMDAAGRAMWARWMSLVREHRTREGQMRPDLYYTPTLEARN